MTAMPNEYASAAPASDGEAHEAASEAISARRERREARRRSLMLRSAKVACETGEYVCVVRDVSEIGTSISFLHDVPPDERIILALANGLTYPIERVWCGKRQAGYRFATTVSLEEFMHESAPFEARPVRLEFEAAARLIDGREVTGAKMLDISTHGAKFESLSDHPLERLIGFQIAGMPQFLGQICWREETRYGLRFQHPLTLLELAGTALKLQPFSTPDKGDFGELGKARAA